MSVERVIGVVSVVVFPALTTLTGCADDSQPPPPTSESKSQLSDGLGNDIPMPQVPGAGDGSDEPWKNPNAYPAPPDRDHDPVGPEGYCELDWITLFDPGRGKNVEVPVINCGG